MWLWLQKRLPKSINVWVKLAMFSTSLHLMLLFTIFFVYKGDAGGFNFEISKGLCNSDAPIVFMPFHKRVVQKNGSRSTKKSKAAAKVQQAVAVKEQPKIIEEKKADQATTLVSPPKKKKVSVDKKAAKQKKKVSPAQAIAEKAAAEKIAKEKKAAEDKKNKEADKASADKEKMKDLELASTHTAQDSIAQDDVRYMGREDLDALKMQEFIGQEVGQYWNPPVGVPQDIICEVALVVDWEGKLKDIKMVNPSNVVVYDVSVRNAVKKMSFPKWLWGKEFSITFKQ